MTETFARSRTVTSSEVSKALQASGRAIWSVVVFSAVVNVLMLAGPLYMLQIYDRVLSSRSVPTLVALTAFLIIAFAFQGILELIRQRIVVRAGALFDDQLGRIAHRAVITLGARTASAAEAHQPIRDLDQVRTFMTSAGPLAIIDMPWVPFFLAVCFLIHPWVGYFSLAGAIVLFVLTLQTERASRKLVQGLN